MPQEGFKWGTWWTICDRCGFKYKSNKLFKEAHTGLMVCQPCLDKQNPQAFARIQRTESVIPWARPEPTDILVANTPDCDLYTVIPYPTVFDHDFTIYKGWSLGPVSILDGATVSVVCEWEIR